MDKVFFIDFDGTITKVDTCVAMVEAFAGDGWEELESKWERKEISTEECANAMFKLFQAGIDDIKKLVEGIEIDDHFKEFLGFCRERGYRVYVLSDGYDFCIETIFKKYGVKVPYHANRLMYKDGFKIECPYLNSSCGKCGTCKRTLMESLKGKDAMAVYIGDGYSDTCAAAGADMVFAKGPLYSYCVENGINAARFGDFSDIIDCLR